MAADGQMTDWLIGDICMKDKQIDNMIDDGR